MHPYLVASVYPRRRRLQSTFREVDANIDASRAFIPIRSSTNIGIRPMTRVHGRSPPGVTIVFCPDDALFAKGFGAIYGAPTRANFKAVPAAHTARSAFLLPRGDMATSHSVRRHAIRGNSRTPYSPEFLRCCPAPLRGGPGIENQALVRQTVPRNVASLGTKRSITKDSQFYTTARNR